MSETTVDCQKLACPQPVILVKRRLATAAPDRLRVIVDNEAARENVGRFLASQGYDTVCTQEGDIRQITATRVPADKTEASAPQPAEQEAAKILVLVPAAVIGAGDDMLGAKLMKNFLGTLPELGDSLWRVILLNGGVALAAEGSPVLAELQELEANGVGIFACGACLEHFGLLAAKAVGRTTNMLDVVTDMHLADKIIRV